MADRFIITNRPGSLEKKHYHLHILLRNSCFSYNRHCILDTTLNVKTKLFISFFYTLA